MDYEKKYKEAQGWIEKIYPTLQHEQQMEAEAFFPELKESEDEKIRKRLIKIAKTWKDGGYACGNDDEIDNILAWLEKQGELQDKGEISDGYHTFNELYYYRMLYNAAFFNMLPKEWTHKSKRHNDGEECFGGGWFIVMANLPTGQISNHYELKDWNLFQIPEKEVADKWDGHTPQEAADRLHKYLLEKQGEQTDKIVERAKTERQRVLVTESDGSANIDWDTRSLEDAITLLKHGLNYLQEIEVKKQIMPNSRFGGCSECIPTRFDKEKQGKKESNDKNEPKFKVGEQIKHNKANIICKIISVNSGSYYVENIETSGRIELFNAEQNFHLWTIKDAKDGDVLVSPPIKGQEGKEQIFIFKGINSRDYVDNCIEYYCRVYEGVFYENENGNGYMGTTSSPLYPATKEQRNILFAKMKEAGYEWNTEKKELKKISQRMVSAEAKEALYDKPAWSEEDDIMIEETLYFLREYQQSNRCNDENGMQNSVSCEKWLKSLKQRITD